MTVYLNYDIEMLRSLKALYKYTDRFLTIFSLADASNSFNREKKKTWKFVNFNGIKVLKVLSTGQHRTKCNSVSCAALRNVNHTVIVSTESSTLPLVCWFSCS